MVYRTCGVSMCVCVCVCVRVVCVWHDFDITCSHLLRGVQYFSNFGLFIGRNLIQWNIDSSNWLIFGCVVTVYYDYTIFIGKH